MAFYVYRVGYKAQIESIFNHGYSRQFLGSNEGTDYGDGVYCNIVLKDSLERLRYTNGGCLFKCEIVNGLDRYLIFNGKLAQETYGSTSIKDQVFQLFGDDANKVWRDFTLIMKNDTSARQHMDGRTAELLQVLLSPRRRSMLYGFLEPSDRGRNVRKEYEALFKKHNIRGAIYRGMKDGLCLVAYNFGECLPVAYSIDGGRTWIKKECNGAKVDVTMKYGLKYKKIDDPIVLSYVDDNGENQSVSFSRVQKKNGKFNYIDANSGEEISPIDFDSVTLMNPDNAEFSIEYKGFHFDACPDGFYDDEEEGHTFDELPEFVKILQTEALSFSFKTICESILGENSMDEAMHGEFEVPSENDLDTDQSIPSIYHVTTSDVVDSIFKYGFDREFNGKNASVYGDGVYTAISPQDATHQLGCYGNVMIQGKVIGGFKRFLIFDERIAKKYYGENYRLVDQLSTFIPRETAIRLFDRFRYNVRQYFNVAQEYDIRGAIYNWGGVKAVLPYDFSCVIPYAISTDGGKTFRKKLTNDSLKRFHTSMDVNWIFKNKYKKIDKPIAGYNENNEETGFSRVQKKNGKFNYVDIQSMKEISPIDFDSVTLMNPDNGEFSIEYKGFHFDACLDGFYDDEEEGHTFDELPEFVKMLQKNDF